MWITWWITWFISNLKGILVQVWTIVDSMLRSLHKTSDTWENFFMCHSVKSLVLGSYWNICCCCEVSHDILEPNPAQNRCNFWNVMLKIWVERLRNNSFWISCLSWRESSGFHNISQNNASSRGPGQTQPISWSWQVERSKCKPRKYIVVNHFWITFATLLSIWLLKPFGPFWIIPASCFALLNHALRLIQQPARCRHHWITIKRLYNTDIQMP